MRLFTITAILFSMLLVTGCGRHIFSSNDEYDRVWIASQTVLNRHGLIVKPSKYREDSLVAVSRVQGDFATMKNRVKVVTRIVLDEDGYYTPNVRVLEQIDVSEVNAWGHSNYQPNNHWVNSANNASMEAKIYNEIMEIVNSQVNTYSGQAWQPVMNQEEGHNEAAVPAEYDSVSKEEDAEAIEFTSETF